MSNRGFTLMELVVTLALLAIMTAIAVPATSSWRKNAQYKATARDVVSLLRRGRSMAVQQNKNIKFKIDFTNKQFLLDDDGTIIFSDAFPNGVTIEATNSFVDSTSWQKTVDKEISFRPQGSSIEMIFVRINEDDKLQILVDSTATGLAHM